MNEEMKIGKRLDSGTQAHRSAQHILEHMLVFSRHGDMVIRWQPMQCQGHGLQPIPGVRAQAQSLLSTAASTRRKQLLLKSSPRVDTTGHGSPFEIQSKAVALHKRNFEINLVTVQRSAGSRLSRAKALPDLMLPAQASPLSLRQSIEQPCERQPQLPIAQQQSDHGKYNDEETQLCVLEKALEARLSPLQLTLPDSPVLRAAWLRSVAAYERLRMRQAAKRLRLEHRRKLRGLVTISESL